MTSPANKNSQSGGDQFNASTQHNNPGSGIQFPSANFHGPVYLGASSHKDPAQTKEEIKDPAQTKEEIKDPAQTNEETKDPNRPKEYVNLHISILVGLLTLMSGLEVRGQLNGGMLLPSFWSSASLSVWVLESHWVLNIIAQAQQSKWSYDSQEFQIWLSKSNVTTSTTPTPSVTSSTTSSTPSAQIDQAGCPGADNQNITVNGVTFTIYCYANCNFNANDTGHFKADSLLSCAGNCTKYSDCQGAVYVMDLNDPSTCWFKSQTDKHIPDGGRICMVRV